jgi:hypothetical protein
MAHGSAERLAKQRGGGWAAGQQWFRPSLLITISFAWSGALSSVV